MTLDKKTQNILYYVAIGLTVAAILLYVFLPKNNMEKAIAKQLSVQSTQTIQQEIPTESNELVQQEQSTKGLKQMAPPQTPSIGSPEDLEAYLDVIFAFLQDIFALLVATGTGIAAIWLKLNTGKPGTGGAVAAETPSAVKRTRTTRKT